MLSPQDRTGCRGPEDALPLVPRVAQVLPSYSSSAIIPRRNVDGTPSNADLARLPSQKP